MVSCPVLDVTYAAAILLSSESKDNSCGHRWDVLVNSRTLNPINLESVITSTSAGWESSWLLWSS